MVVNQNNCPCLHGSPPEYHGAAEHMGTPSEVGGRRYVDRAVTSDASWCTPCWSVHAGAGAARQNGVSSYQDAALWVGSLPSPSCLDDTGALCTALLTSNTSQWLQ